MGLKPCLALLLCLCSCSLDTSPDILPASADASPPKWQRASLHFDAPQQPQTAVKRARREDDDAGDEDAGAKQPSRDAGRPASDRPATSMSRDAGSVDAGAKQESNNPVGKPEASGDVRDDSAPKDAGSAADAETSHPRDAGSEERDRNRNDGAQSGRSNDNDDGEWHGRGRGRNNRSDGDRRNGSRHGR